MKKIFFTFFFLILSSSYSISGISQYYGSAKLNLDEIGVVNFIRYLDGRFYGEDLSREMHNNSPMYYAISEDGKIGYGWFCRASSSNACSDDFTAFRIIEYCNNLSICFVINNIPQLEKFIEILCAVFSRFPPFVFL